MKEIDNENATKTNATRGKVHTIQTNKYIAHVPNKPTPTRIREKEIDKNTQTTMCTVCTNNNVNAIDF